MKTKYHSIVIGGFFLVMLGITVSATRAEAVLSKFLVGDRIYVAMSNVNVRSAPAGTLLGAQPSGARGTVTQGPVVKFFDVAIVNWWFVNFDSGLDGWVGEDRLAKVSPSPTPTPTPTPALVQQTYIVVAGDTLSAIGRKLGIAWQDIAAWNNMVFPYYLNIGQILKISVPSIIPTPTPALVQQTYIVVAGDTLSAIGRKLGIAWQDIAAWNNMVFPYYLNIGQILKISTSSAVPTPTPTPTMSITGYDSLILSDKPVMYLTMSSPTAGVESDKTGNGHNATYKGGAPQKTVMPNGDAAADFNGMSQYLAVPSSSAFSISTTNALTWEAWIRPDVLQFPNDSAYGYVDWMGKCQDYGPTCEWEARIYSTSNPEGRTNRISAYVFNNSAGLGSAADWQPNSNVIKAGQWLHVVGEYQTITTPSGCNSVYPGSVNIWVNGVKWNQSFHMPTGCMSQYRVIPKASTSPLNIGTMALETWFPGAIGKVAIYNRLLSQAEINEHFTAMAGKQPTGSCANTCGF